MLMQSAYRQIAAIPESLPQRRRCWSRCNLTNDKPDEDKFPRLNGLEDARDTASIILSTQPQDDEWNRSRDGVLSC